jgi:hypothetical protein
MNNKDIDHVKNQDMKIKDIVKSIKGIIDNQDLSQKEFTPDFSDSDPQKKEEFVLELTNVFYPFSAKKERDDKLLSDDIKLELLSKIEKFITKVEKKGYFLDLDKEVDASIDTVTLNIMRPLIKEWLDNNLSKLVEKVISEEIKQLVPKKN